MPSRNQSPWTGLLVAVRTCLLSIWVPVFALAAEQTHEFTAHRRVGDKSEVRVKMEVAGTLKILQGKQSRDLPINVTGECLYDEQLASISKDPDSQVAYRRYRAAEAQLKIGNNELRPRLRGDRRVMSLMVAPESANFAPAEGFLTREELELIDMPANSMLVDRLLPTEPLKIGGTWQLPTDVMPRILGLDLAHDVNVRGTLLSIEKGVARFSLEGKVAGSVDGTSSEIELTGRMYFDTQAHRVTWFAMIIKEKRAIGHAAPGLDVVARVKVKIRPNEGNLDFSAVRLAESARETSTGQRLEYQSEESSFGFVHDARWKITDETDSKLVARLIDRGDLIAQCNLAFVDKGDQKRVSLENFQRDVHQALGDFFGQFVRASQGQTSGGHGLLEVVAIGKVSELPIQWNYYQIIGPDGQQAVAAFTVEEPLVPRLETLDREIVESFHFSPPTVLSSAEQNRLQ